MFKFDSVRSIIIDAEREWLDDSPFKGITKLLEISKICKTPSKMEWVLKSVVNRIKAGSMDTGEFTLRNLAGRQGKQWCEVLLKQRELRTHMLGPFIDSRNIIPAAKLKIREVFASPDSYVEKLRPLADEEDAGLDTSWQASLPRSAHLTLELIEQTCFSMSGVEDQLLRVGIRNGKIAEEILSEYSPFKESVKAIDDALLQEHQAIVKQKKEAQDDSTTDNRLATAAEPDDVTLVDEVPSHVEDQRAAHAKRILASFLVLEVEGTRSQTALAGDLAKHALVKVKGDETSGNVMIIFDVNGFGETMTAPHIRRPPITQEVLRKLYKSLNFARHGEAEPTIVPEGEVHVVLDGGRKNNAVFSKIFGAGPGMKRVKTPGPRTLVRQTLVLLSEPSVRARKMRHTKGRVCFNCTQGMLWWYNSHTLIPTRSHKFLPDLTNASNVYGPVALESWPSLPTLTVADKKFWGKRRVACGGKSITGEDQDDDDGSTEQEAEEEEVTADGKDVVMELPNVGCGRGGGKTLAPTTLQPIVYHEFPVTFWQGIMHAVSASTIIDLTPQSGRLAKMCVTSRIGYVGVCQTDYQKQYIMGVLQDAVMESLADPGSVLSVPRFTGCNKREAEEPAACAPLKKTKAESDSDDAQPAQTGSPSSNSLSPALLAMLQSAKEGQPAQET